MSKKAEATNADPGTQVLEDFFPEDAASGTVVETAEPVAEVKPEPAKPKHPAYLVRSAKNVGFDDSEIESYTTAELKEAVNIVAMTRQQDVRERQVLEGVQRGPDGKFVKKEAEPEPEFNLSEVGVDMSEFDEDTQGRLAKALTPLAKQLKQMKTAFETKMADLDAREKQREVNAHLDRLDQRFVENADLFGEGKRAKLDPDSDEFSRRIAVANEIGRIAQAHKGIEFDEAFDRAVKRLGFTAPKPAPKVEPVEEPEVVKDPYGYANGSTVKPTVRETKPPPKGTKAAIAHVAAALKERGAIVDTSEHDELPD